jgi:hypothetical protein
VDLGLEARRFDLVGEAASDILLAKQNRIRNYFAEIVGRLNIVETTRTDSGQTLDWIQRPVKEDRPPPPDPGPRPATSEHLDARIVPSELEEQPWNRGPDGTVPIARFDVEAYLAAVGDQVPDDVSGIFSQPSPSSNQRYHVGWELDGGTTYRYRGVAAQINLWKAPGLEGGDTNIAQIFAGRGPDSVEVGKWQYYPGSPPTDPGAARLFVYFTTEGHAAYDSHHPENGGYSTEGAVWVPYDNYYYADMVLSTSIDGGQQYIADVALTHFGPNDPGYGPGQQWEIQQGWWVSMEGFNGPRWLGYWPSCIDQYNQATTCSGGNAYQRIFHSSTGIDSSANDVQVYGEVFDHHYPNSTTTDMGSGKHAAANYTHAAYMEWFRILPNIAGSASWQLFQNASGTGRDIEQDAACYSMALKYFDAYDNWFFYGGPGYVTGGGCVLAPFSPPSYR